MRGVMYLVWMECQTAGCSNSLSQESLVVLDGTQVVPRRVVYTDKLVRGTTVTRKRACEELHKKYCTCISSDKISFDLLYILSMNDGHLYNDNIEIYETEDLNRNMLWF